MTQKKNIGSCDFFIEKKTMKGSSLHLHQHTSYEIYYLVNGKREYFIDDRHFSIPTGSIVVIPPKTLHCTTNIGGLRYLIHFSEAFLQKYFTKQSLDAILPRLPFVFTGDEMESERIKKIFSVMLSEFSGSEVKAPEEQEALLAGYLYQLLFSIANESNAYVPSNDADLRITQIIQYINKNYGYINEIEEVANSFFISKCHLCRLFKRNLGITFVTYLNMIKIQAACNMIKDGVDNLNQIALQCGFNSYSYFCKVFKSEKGITPTEYRKRCKQ